MAFIIRHCCGIVCAPITGYDAKRLNLAPMVAANDAPLGTAFTVSVDVRHGLNDRAFRPSSAPTPYGRSPTAIWAASDFVRPGHVFPAHRASEGGVLMRSGHTEAAVDLCKSCRVAAGRASSANSPTTMAPSWPASRSKVLRAEHDLKRISVADLIAYRQSREKLDRACRDVSREDRHRLHGDRLMRSVTPFDPVQHFAFVHGDIGSGEGGTDPTASRRHRRGCHQGRGRDRQVFARFRQEGRASSSTCETEPPACRHAPASCSRSARGGAHARMARGRARRADPP